MIDVSRALKVQGWTSEKELLWLAEQASKRTRILEIGSWKGRSAVAMAMNTSGVVYCVDTWEGSVEHQGREDLSELFATFRLNTAGLDNIIPIPSHSLQAARHMKEAQFERFDMIFIDGDHSYEGVKNDILAWRPLLAPGGLFAGHDFDGGRPGTVKAVKELIPQRRQPAGSIWMEV